MHENDNELYKYFHVEYRLNQKIPFTEISTDIPNIEFVTEDNYLIGFKIIINKILTGTEGENKIIQYSKILTDLLSILSHRYIALEEIYRDVPKCEGITPIYNDLIIIWNNEGAPVKLDIKINFLKLINSSYLEQLHLKYLAKATIFYQEKSPEYAIMEAFKIIEEKKQFSEYYKYFSLRNLVAHSPYNFLPNYKRPTLDSFDIYFHKNDFDYIKYERKDNKLEEILLDFESDKTQRKLNEVSFELIEKVKQSILQI